jgi:glutamyl-tRNA reductase
VNLLVVGVSHRTAGVPLLERLTVAPDQTAALLTRLLAQEYVGEALVLSTCNRVEVYASVSAFHGGLADIGAVLAERAGCSVNELAQHLYVSYDTDAVRHAFRVAAGLDSMVVGEAQILGQLREAYSTATVYGTAGRLLHELLQQALRVGKRAHAETGIDRAGQSVVTAALRLGLAQRDGRDAEARDAEARDTEARDAEARDAEARDTEARDTEAFDGDALVIGAGAMGALALATLRRAGAGRLYIANRSAERARRLAGTYSAEVVPFDRLGAALSQVDMVVCATASPDAVLTPGLVAEAGRPLLVLDLAVPRDVAPGVAEIPGVHLIDLERLSATEQQPAGHAEVAAAEAIVNAEVGAFRSWLRSSDVAPTVAALRARADEVVVAELGRLRQRRPDLTDDQRADVAHAVHRVVQRLLHVPSVRVRQLAAEPGGEAYAEALRALFDLEVPQDFQDIDAVAATEVAVTRPEATT